MKFKIEFYLKCPGFYNLFYTAVYRTCILENVLKPNDHTF